MLTAELERYKTQKEESRNIDGELALEKQDFETRIIPHAKLSAKQAFWSRYSVQSEEPNLSSSPTIVEVPKELPKVSMVNSSLKKLKFHLASFDMSSGKVLVIAALKEILSKLKGKAVATEAVATEAVTLHPIDPKLLKIDVAPLASKLRNNRIAYTDYLRHAQEETTTLREIVESERLLNPLNTSLDYACKYTKHIQKLLVILQQNCPCINDLGTKLMAVTPKNNDQQIRLTKHIPSSGNTPSSASGSQPQGNTKKDRIQRAPSKAKKNKLEDHPRTVGPSLNNKKSVVDTKTILSVTNSKSNVNADLKCATCNGYLFSDNHDSCVLAYINYVNANLKSKSGNVCPLTRIATTAIVPLRKPILIESNTDKPVVTLVYSRKSKAAVTPPNLYIAAEYNIGVLLHNTGS
uniref:Integrase, catalytic region, zinc finger, CCHC-type, peptidase aspartic, catalytic n=1 Tax=Tanacetum cinerariifolium TaxID=118510 RepID=A0A699H1B3_TANCI|nr:hypothetical protein [Tanacetum cinerariifolium]